MKAKDTPDQQTYCWQQVAEHNTPDDCWISIRDKVYNVTEWIDQHPGGRDMIVLNGGKDATQLFEAYHDEWVNQKYLTKYEVGQLVGGSEYPSFPKQSEFYKELKKRVNAFFRSEKLKKNGIQGRTDATPMLLRSAVLGAISVFVWLLALQLTVSGYFGLACLCSLVVGTSHALISLMPVHEASHGASTSSPWMWRFLGAMHDWLLGASFYNWLHQHLLGHHPFTQVEQLDPDIVTADPDARRIKTSQPWLSPYRWQHLYMPVLYGLLAAKYRINDLTIVFSVKKNGQIRLNDLGAWHWFNFVGGKVFWFFFRFVLPAYVLGSVWQAFVLLSISDVLTSYYLALVFQPSHVVGEAIWPRINENNEIEMDWAEMQVRTTIDYGINSPLTHFFTGGLNFQVAHHLFPGVCQLHYPKIAPLVKEVCDEFNIKYTVVPTYWDALMCHFRYLYSMGQPTKVN